MHELEVELTPAGTNADLAPIVGSLSGDPSFEPVHRSKLQRALEGVGQRDAAVTGMNPAGTAEPRDRTSRAVEFAVDLCNALPDRYGTVVPRRLIDAAAVRWATADRVGHQNSAAVTRDLLLAGPQAGITEPDRLLLGVVFDFLAEAVRKEQDGDRSPSPDPGHGPMAPELAALTGAQLEQARALVAILYLSFALDAALPFGSGIAAITTTERRTVLTHGRLAEDAALPGRAGTDFWKETFGSRLKLVALKDGDEPPMGLRFDQSLAGAGRLLLRRQFRQLLRCEPGARQGDEEALHDARVAVRRMRTALQLLQRAYIRREVRPLQTGLKRAGDVLGAVRDPDVQLEALREGSKQFEGGAALDELVVQIERKRDRGRQRLLKYLDGEEFTVLSDRFNKFVDEGGSGVRGGKRVCDVLAQLVWRRYAAVRAYEPAIFVAGFATLHELRKDAKQLRYLLEFFEELLGSRTPELIDQVTAMQDALGRLHDAVVMRDLLAEQPSIATGELPTGVGAFRDRTLAAITEHRRAALELWPDLSGRRFRRRLANVVTET
jgi:CHAD domain-containing protein